MEAVVEGVFPTVRTPTIDGSLSLEWHGNAHDAAHGVVDPILRFHWLADDRLLDGHGVSVGGVVFQPAGGGTVGTEASGDTCFTTH